MGKKLVLSPKNLESQKYDNFCQINQLNPQTFHVLSKQFTVKTNKFCHAAQSSLF